MKKLTVFAVALILVAGVISTAKATTIYFDDGTVYDLKENESVYVSSGRVWELNWVNPIDLRIEALVPLATEEPEETEVDCLGFGPTTCASGFHEQSSDDNI